MQVRAIWSFETADRSPEFRGQKLIGGNGLHAAHHRHGCSTVGLGAVAKLALAIVSGGPSDIVIVHAEAGGTARDDAGGEQFGGQRPG